MRSEIEKIISGVGEKTRYKDTIGGVDVEPILWHVIPPRATDQICSLIVERVGKMPEEYVATSERGFVCVNKEHIDQLIKELKGEENGYSRTTNIRHSTNT